MIKVLFYPDFDSEEGGEQPKVNVFLLEVGGEILTEDGKPIVLEEEIDNE